MADTVRTESYLVTALADNTTGAITPQVVRDMLLTVVNYAAPMTAEITIPEARTYYIDLSATESYTIDSLVHRLGSGTLSVSVRINGTSVNSLSAVSPTSTKATTTATGANTVNIGDDVTLVLTSPSSADTLSLKINRTRL